MANKLKYLVINEKGALMGVLTEGNTVIKVSDLAAHKITAPKLKGLSLYYNKNVYPNELKVLAKYGTDTDRISGCDVSVAGLKFKVSLAELYKLTRYLNCKYTVRQKGNLLVLAGNKGYTEKDIRFIPTYHTNKTSPEVLNTASAVIKEKVNNQKFSFIDIINFLKACGGSVILLESSKYTARNEQVSEVGDAFVNLNIGQISEPNIKYSKKLNCTLPFIKPGYVKARLSMSDAAVKVPTYVFRDKVVYINSMTPNIERLGVAVPPTYAESFRKAYAAGIKQEFTDTPEAKQLLRYANKNNCLCFELDLDKLVVMTTQTATNYILKSGTIKELLVQQAEIDTVTRVAKKLEAKAKEKISAVDAGELIPDKVYKGLEPFVQTIEDMQTLANLGVDLKYGNYTPTKKKQYQSKADSADKPQIEDLVYDITLDAKDVPITKLTVALVNQMNEIDERITHAVTPEGVINHYEITTCLSLLSEIKQVLKKKSAQITERLWLHKVASLHLGSNMHFYGEADWQKVSSRAVKTIKYVNEKTPGITLSVSASAELTKKPS